MGRRLAETTTVTESTLLCLLWFAGVLSQAVICHWIRCPAVGFVLVAADGSGSRKKLWAYKQGTPVSNLAGVRYTCCVTQLPVLIHPEAKCRPH